MDTAIQHQAAISLNNAAVRSLTLNGSYNNALVTLRDSIRTIKSCIIDSKGTGDQSSLHSPEEVHRMISQGYQRLEESSSVHSSVVPCSVFSPQSGKTSSTNSVIGDATISLSTRNQQKPSVIIQALSSKPCDPSTGKNFQAQPKEIALSSLILLLDKVPSMSIVGNVPEPNLFLYPIIIDDDAIYNFSAIDMYDHSIIILYNFGIVYQCLAFVEQCESQGTTGKNFTMGGRYQTYSRAADHIFRMIYQSVNDQVQPQRLFDLMNGEIKADDFDTSMSGKYLPMMILISYNMILVSHSLQLPAELTHNCNLLDKLLFLLSAFEWNYFKDCFDTAVAA